MRALRRFGIVAVWLLAACLNAWAMAALYFDFAFAGREWLLPAIYLVVLTLFLAILKSRVFRIGACFTGFCIVLVCWLSLKPSNDRNWQANLSRTPWAEIAGDRVTIHNFRHCYYHEEAEFTCEWLTKEVFLSQPVQSITLTTGPISEIARLRRMTDACDALNYADQLSAFRFAQPSPKLGSMGIVATSARGK